MKSSKVKLIIFIYLLAIVWGLFLLETKGEKFPIKFDRYTVQSGDTLTSICADYPHDDIRELVYEVRKLNGINPMIHAGDEIMIPIYKEGE